MILILLDREFSTHIHTLTHIHKQKYIHTRTATEQYHHILRPIPIKSTPAALKSPLNYGLRCMYSVTTKFIAIGCRSCGLNVLIKWESPSQSLRPFDIEKLIKRVRAPKTLITFSLFKLILKCEEVLRGWWLRVGSEKCSDCALIAPNSRRQMWQITLMATTK